MIVFSAQGYYNRFASALCFEGSGADLGRCQLLRHPSGEISASVHQGVEGKTCLIVGSVVPPDGQMLEFLLLADAIKRAGARSVWAFLPYLAYSRQDRFAPGQGGGIATIGSLFKAAGIDSVVTIDLHSELDKKLIGLPVISLSPALTLFAGEIQSMGWPAITVVAPDEDAGTVRRNEALAEALGVEGSVVHLVRDKASIVHLGMVGEVGPRVVVANDILDSGRTLVAACNVLRQSGVQEIAVAATHGLFNGEIWKELFELGVKTLFVTDSCPEARKTEEPEVKVVSIKPLLPEVLAAVRKGAKDEFIHA